MRSAAARAPASLQPGGAAPAADGQLWSGRANSRTRPQAVDQERPLWPPPNVVAHVERCARTIALETTVRRASRPMPHDPGRRVRLEPAELAMASVPLVGKQATSCEADQVPYRAVALKPWRFAARVRKDPLSLMPPGSGERVHQE